MCELRVVHFAASLKCGAFSDQYMLQATPYGQAFELGCLFCLCCVPVTVIDGVVFVFGSLACHASCRTLRVRLKRIAGSELCCPK